MRFSRIAHLSILTASIPAMGAAQQTFAIPNGTGSVDALGGPNNAIRTVASTSPAYVFGNELLIVSGSLTEQPGHEATFASEARIRISKNANRALYADFSFTDSGDYEGVFNLTPGAHRVSLGGPLVGQTIAPGELLRFEFYEALEDGTAGAAEQVYNGLAFATTAAPAQGQLITVPTGTPSVDALGDPDNAHFFVTVTSSTTVGGSMFVNGGSLVEMAGHTGTFAKDVRLRLRKVGEPLLYADFQLATGSGYVGTYAVPSGIRPVTSGPLVGRPLVPGDVLEIEVYEDFQDGAAKQPEQLLNGVTFNLSSYTPPTTPTSFVDFGTLTGNATNTQAFGAAQIKWYKFTVPNPLISSGSLEIHTRGTTQFNSVLGVNNDTSIALYGSNGLVYASNDDENPNANVVTSRLLFGPGQIPLLADTYYLAVGGYPSAFLPGFSAVSESDNVGPVSVNLVYVPSSVHVSGTVNLQNYVGSFAGQVVGWEIRSDVGAVLDSGLTALSANGGYEIQTAIRGTNRTVRIKGSHWLAQAVTGLNLSVPTTANFSLINGDVDGDNEVGGSDLSALSAAFLSAIGDPAYSASADLDGDGEVGSSDLSILSGSFLQSGD